MSSRAYARQRANELSRQLKTDQQKQTFCAAYLELVSLAEGEVEDGESAESEWELCIRDLQEEFRKLTGQDPQ